jgi:hypothetical protein
MDSLMVPIIYEMHKPIVVPVKIFGVDANNRPFYQDVTGHELRADGASLESLESPLKPGGIVGVEFKDRKARARVIWACRVGIKTVRVGIQLLDASECPWIESLNTTPHPLPSGKEEA